MARVKDVLRFRGPRAENTQEPCPGYNVSIRSRGLRLRRAVIPEEGGGGERPNNGGSIEKGYTQGKRWRRYTQACEDKGTQ
ncbi:hypothetical protein FKM82_021068 [Ascaphus truei]